MIDILLHVVEFMSDLNSILSFRSLNSFMNKRILQWLSKIPFELVQGKRTMISMRHCDICNLETPDLKQVVYPFTGDYNRLILNHCNNSLFCRINALRSMNAELRSNHIYLLRKKLPLPDDDVEIPRSNGSISMGMLRNDHMYKINNIVYVGADWIFDDTAFQKLVPMKNYMDTEKLKDYENHMLQSTAFVE